MADELYALTGDDVEVLRSIVAMYRRGELTRDRPPLRQPVPPRCDILFGVADAAVNGTSDALSDPPSGTLNVYELTSAGATTDSGRDETFYNLSSVSRTTSEYTVCVRDYKSGLFMGLGINSTAAEHKKPLCRFVLDATLATSDSSADALLTNQYGEGTAHSTGAITVYNLLTHDAGCYLFSGDSGDAGYAQYDSGTNWYITQMECAT